MVTSTISNLDARIHSISAEALSPIVQRATGSTGQQKSWTCQPVQTLVGALGASAVYRFSGSIQVQSEERPWSLILKLISPSLEKAGGIKADPASDRREFEFYQSDLRHLLPAGFRAAACFEQSIQQGEAGQDEYWLWLEDLTPLANDDWNLEQNAQAAQALGKFNGVFLAGRPLPTAAWLNRDVFRQYVDMAAPVFNQLFEQRDHPRVRRMYSSTVVDSLAEMWRRREEHLAILDRLPQTLCHGDAQRTNLFLTTNASGQPETVAIDWANISVASIGMDLAQILLMSFNRFDEAFTRALDTVLFENYLDGMRAAGWQGDPRWIRLGYTAGIFKIRMAYVYRMFPMVISEDASQNVMRKRYEAIFAANGLSFEAGVDKMAWAHAYLGELFEESLALREQLL